ncbi:MAG: Lar family restriction alleviation protein [Deltaproteobacteria bacterium]|jgi:hypothetical protein|nr:Lar family restriction alleviation protein [Deltaproteobacteria bacterium]
MVIYFLYPDNPVNPVKKVFIAYKIKGIMHWNVSCMNDHCLVHVETDDFESEEEAIGAWNKRVS